MSPSRDRSFFCSNDTSRSLVRSPERFCISGSALEEEAIRREIERDVVQKSRYGIPHDTHCSPKDWCDARSGVCTTVCERGTVEVAPWLAAASRLQARLARSLPFCYTTLLGTHNSAITLADGYGNLDPVYQALFKYIKWSDPKRFKHAILRTNNQWLSLTDQLNLGVRVVELDTHWVAGRLRIAHCGGLHVGPLNALVQTLNVIAKLLGRSIHWDTETLGCNPSLSSIAADDQRPLIDALKEIKDWLDADANAQELLVLFFDDQPDLKQWGVATRLKEEILQVFPRDWIFTSEDLAAAGGEWPRASDMVAGGRRLLLVSIEDFGRAVSPLIFRRGKHLCSWKEPPLTKVEGEPACRVDPWGIFLQPFSLYQGSLVRVNTCELQYGPLNCDFQWGETKGPILDESTLPGFIDCSLNMPSPDLLTPQRAAAAIWTWAPGHPFSDGEMGDDGGVVRSRASTNDEPTRSSTEWAIVSAVDGRWRVTRFEEGSLPSGTFATTCRLAGIKTPYDSSWVLAFEGRGQCPENTTWDVPRHPKENAALAELLRKNGADGGWLPMQGPRWEIDDISIFGDVSSMPLRREDETLW